jgi:antitoxin PrlF
MKRQVKMDRQGRVTTPKAIREASVFEPGSERIVEFDYDSGAIALRPVVNPFDVLAEQALREYEAG